MPNPDLVKITIYFGSQDEHDYIRGVLAMAQPTMRGDFDGMIQVYVSQEIAKTIAKVCASEGIIVEGVVQVLKSDNRSEDPE